MSWGLTCQMAQEPDSKTFRMPPLEHNCLVLRVPAPLSVLGDALGLLPGGAVMDMRAAQLLGATLVAGLPADIAKLLQSSPRPELPSQMADLLGGASTWVLSGDVGLSSNYLLWHLVGGRFNALSWLQRGSYAKEPESAYPHDANDLTRCRRLLEAAPELRPRFAEAAQKMRPGGWSKLLRDWDLVCKMMDEEGPAMPHTNLYLRAAFESDSLGERISARLPSTGGNSHTAKCTKPVAP